MFPISSLRFGWSKANPPEYVLPLDTKRDISFTPNGPVATDVFVHKAAEKLHRDQDTGKRLKESGFFAIPNLEVVGPTPVILKFFNNFISRVFADYADNHPKELNIPVEDRVLVSLTTEDGTTKKSGQGNYISPFAKPDEDGRRWTEKAPHFDPGARLVGHLYTPKSNVTGGDFQAYDLSQWSHDTGKRIEDVLLDNGHKEVAITSTELAKYQVDVPTSFSDTVAVVFNNDAGIIHGATPIRVTDPAKPIVRDFHRTSLSRKTGKQVEGITIRSLHDFKNNG